MAGNEGFALAASDGLENLAGRFWSGHDEPRGDGVLGFGVERTAIVDAADVGGDEAGADESDFDPIKGQFGGDGIGERAP